MLRLRRYAWRVLPLLLLLVLYWPGLTNWFYQDDFGWLNLRHDVHSFQDLGPALFAPKAHGNIRPLGENAYFLALSSLFGVDALPFRIVAFLTQMASLVLLGSIARQMTASRAGGFWAQILWIANSGLAPAMCWTSIYNQILSGFFFLLAFWFLLRSIETGAARTAIGHWAAFVLGLAALGVRSDGCSIFGGLRAAVCAGLCAEGPADVRSLGAIRLRPLSHRAAAACRRICIALGRPGTLHPLDLLDVGAGAFAAGGRHLRPRYPGRGCRG